MSPVKEPHFLADEIRFENFSPQLQARRDHSGPVATLQEYLKLFQGAGAQSAIGEASVCYLWSPSAARNIAARFPQAKILMLLRDPAERAYSQYLHTMRVAKRAVSFRDFMDASCASADTRIGELYPFLEFGFYCQQIRRYLECFPRNAMGIYFYQDYQHNPQAVLQDMFRFLNVDPGFSPDLSKRHQVSRLPRGGALRSAFGLLFPKHQPPALDPADRSRLIELYRDDIRSLSALLDRDLSAWLDKGDGMGLAASAAG